MWIKIVTTTAIAAASCTLPLMTSSAPVMRPAKGSAALRPVVPVGPFWTRGLFANPGVTRTDPVTGILTTPLEETHIAKIQIQGNTQIPTEEIMPQIKSKPGDLFNSHIMQADMTRVWNMGKFDIVGPFTETTNEDHQMTVVIPVTEKKSMPQTN